MTNEELLLWASTHHWPGLVLSPQGDLLKRGEEYWRMFLSTANQEEIVQVEHRIALWNKREAQAS